jgi:hypothetical protein
MVGQVKKAEYNSGQATWFGHDEYFGARLDSVS